MVNVFGKDGAAALKPFEDPAADSGDDFVLKDHVGATVILTVVGTEKVETKMYGVKDAVKLDRVVSLNGSATPLVYTDVLLFQKAPVSQLRSSAGQTVVAAVESYTNDKGGPFFRFAAPSAEGLAAAEKFMAG